MPWTRARNLEAEQERKEPGRLGGGRPRNAMSREWRMNEAMTKTGNGTGMRPSFRYTLQRAREQHASPSFRYTHSFGMASRTSHMRKVSGWVPRGQGAYLQGGGGVRRWVGSDQALPSCGPRRDVVPAGEKLCGKFVHGQTDRKNLCRPSRRGDAPERVCRQSCGGLFTARGCARTRRPRRPLLPPPALPTPA